MVVKLSPVCWEKMLNAVEDVKQRTLRTAAALEAQGVPYAVIGGNAVAAWVPRVDVGAVRNTRDVSILLRRDELDIVPAPYVSEFERGDDFQLLSLDALVRTKLVANRDKDRTHLRDMVQVGLIDATSPVKYPSPLAERLQYIIDTPDG
jgi:hypothetical protein